MERKRHPSFQRETGKEWWNQREANIWDTKDQGPGLPTTRAAVKKNQTWQRRIPCPARERKGQRRATSKASNYSTSKAGAATHHLHLKDLQASPNRSSGCSPSTRNPRLGTVRASNQDNHFRARRRKEEAASPTTPELSLDPPRRGEQRMLGAVVHRRVPPRSVDGNGSRICQSCRASRFCPILAALREPTNVSLDVFPREVFTNTLEREAVNFGVRYSRAAGLLLVTFHRKSALGIPRSKQDAQVQDFLKKDQGGRRDEDRARALLAGRHRLRRARLCGLRRCPRGAGPRAAAPGSGEQSVPPAALLASWHQRAVASGASEGGRSGIVSAPPGEGGVTE